MIEMSLFDIKGNYFSQFSESNILINKIHENSLKDFYDYLLFLLNSSSESNFVLNEKASIPANVSGDKFLNILSERFVEGVIREGNLKPESEQEVLLIINPDLFVAQKINNQEIEKLKGLFAKAFYKSENISNDYNFVELSGNSEVDIEVLSDDKKVFSYQNNQKVINKDALNVRDDEKSLSHLSKDLSSQKADLFVLKSSQSLEQVLSEQNSITDVNNKKVTLEKQSILEETDIKIPILTRATEKNYETIQEVTNKEVFYVRDEKSMPNSNKDLSSQKTDQLILKFSQSSDGVFLEQEGRLRDVNNQVTSEKQFILKKMDGMNSDIRINLKSLDESQTDKELKMLTEPSDITLKRLNIENSDSSFEHGNSDRNNNFSSPFITKDISEKSLDIKKPFENSLNQIAHKKEMPIHIVSKSKESLEILAEPEGIGKLNIKLTLQNDSINAKIIAFENVGKEVIERNVLNIIDSLTKEGLNINGFSVSLKQKKDEQILVLKGVDKDIRSEGVESRNYIEKGRVSIFV